MSTMILFDLFFDQLNVILYYHLIIQLNCIQSIPAHTSTCTNLKIDPTFKKMAVGSVDYLVSLWDLNELTCAATVRNIE